MEKNTLIALGIVFVVVFVLLVLFNPFIPRAGPVDIKKFRLLCQEFGKKTCDTEAKLPDYWEKSSEVIENGKPVKKSCADVLKCKSCNECGFW